MTVTNHQQIYKERGFVVVPQLFNASEVALLRRETIDIFRGLRGIVPGMLGSPKEMSDEEILSRYVAIHFPHKLSSLIHGILHHRSVVEVLTQLIGPNVKCMQSMLFVKGPGKAGQSWHQDEYYIPTRDKSLAGAWIAIDDATVENGCLWIIPGRHGHILRRIPTLSDEYADKDMVDVRGLERAALPMEVKSGDVVFFNGYTLHSSRRNKTSDRFRIALVNHYMSAESMLPWDRDGSLPPTEDLRDIVLVAGKDPYSWKGIVDANKPYLRPESMNVRR